jgi:solute carrier family 25 thiamine pyrophosphate transporter 19
MVVFGGKHSDEECGREVRDSEHKHTSIQIANASAIAGAISGAVSRFIVGPLDVMKIRFQVQLEPIRNAGGVSKYRSLTQAFATIIKEEGIQVRDRRTCKGKG